jgi:hypothetical protein
VTVDSSGVRRVGSIAQRLRELPYEKRVGRVEQYPSCLSHEPNYTGPSVKEYVDFLVDVGIDVQIVGEVERGYARYPSKMLPAHEHVDQERLPEFLELAHEKGIVVLLYYAMIFNKPLKKERPEWLMQFLDFDRPHPENEGWFCFNSPHRDWLPEYLTEWMDNLDLDGFYFDDTNWGSHGGRPFYPSCCCQYCQELFKADTGLRLPSKVDFTNPDFRQFLKWRYRKFLDFVVHLSARMREKYPDIVLDHHYYARPTTEWVDGHQLNPLPLGEIGDHYFIEAHRTVRETGFIAKAARALGTPFCVWRNPIQSLPECTSGYAPYQEPYSPALHGLEAIINGGSTIFGSFGGPIDLHRTACKTVFSILKQRVDYMAGETVKYVALHYSQQSRDFRPSEMPKNLWQLDYSSVAQRNVHGTYEMLNRSHLLFDMILDDQLEEEYLSAYSVLYLANSCLSEEQCDNIRGFVEAGGTVIATQETSLLDEYGQRRDNFALADVLAIDYVSGDCEGDLGGVLYVPHESALADEFGHVVCFAGHQTHISLRSDGKVETLCTRSSLDGDPPLQNFHPSTPHDSGEPAVTLNSYGNGRAFYISSDVGEGFFHNPYPVAQRFIANLVRRTEAPLRVNAPEAIEVTASMRSEKELVVHLLNNPTPMLPMAAGEEEVTTFFYLRELNPIRDIEISFDGFDLKSARLPLQNRTLEVVGGPATVVVPQVEMHEVILAELA